MVGFFFLLAKRSKQDSHKENGVAEVEVTLFSKMVQEAGLHLHPGQEQDELGKKRFNSCVPSTNHTPSSNQHIFTALLLSLNQSTN